MKFTRNTYRHALRRAVIRENELYALYVKARERRQFAEALVPALRGGYYGLYEEQARAAWIDSLATFARLRRRADRLQLKGPRYVRHSPR